MAEFEKDPRCLMVLFRIYQDISNTWSPSPESFKEIWDSFCRYFPISLKTTDSSLPTRDELQAQLVGCFVSNDGYADHAFPYLIDALDVSRDTLTAYVKVDLYALNI